MNQDLSPETIPLPNAVLCVDCELVTETRFAVCPVCGGHSLLSLATLMGGALVDYKAVHFPGQRLVLFDLHINIELAQVEGSELTNLIEKISTAVSAKLGSNRASFHLVVEPVESGAPMRKAA